MASCNAWLTAWLVLFLALLSGCSEGTRGAASAFRVMQEEIPMGAGDGGPGAMKKH